MNKKVTSKDASYEISEPDEETKGEIYKLYQAIFESDLGDKKPNYLLISLPGIPGHGEWLG